MFFIVSCGAEIVLAGHVALSPLRQKSRDYQFTSGGARGVKSLFISTFMSAWVSLAIRTWNGGTVPQPWAWKVGSCASQRPRAASGPPDT